MEDATKQSVRRVLRNLLIELLVYGGLVTLYAALVFRFLNQPLITLFEENLPLYAVAALFLVVVQGVLLESFTSFLLGRLRLTRLE